MRREAKGAMRSTPWTPKRCVDVLDGLPRMVKDANLCSARRGPVWSYVVWQYTSFSVEGGESKEFLPWSTRVVVPYDSITLSH